MTVPDPVSLNLSDQLAHWAKVSPRAVWIDTGEQTVTFGDADRMARQFQTYLTRWGWTAGEVVAIDAPPALQAILIIALYRLGAVSCQFPGLVVRESFRCDRLISTTVTESPLATHTLFLASHNIQLVDTMEPSESHSPLARSDAFRLIFSSGTTGAPKAIAVTTEVMARRGRQSVETRPEGSSYFCSMDLSTTAGLRSLLWCLQEGTTYLSPRDATSNLGLMKKYGVDVATMSPAQMHALLTAARDVDEHLGHLHSVVYAGSTLDPILADDFSSWFGCRLLTSLGSTEAGIITVRPYDTRDTRDVGYVVAGLELEIVDDDDQPVPAGTVGRIRYRRPGDPQEYFRDPEATAQVFRDGWCYPGDAGELTDDRRLFLRGRLDDLVNVGGLKVDPSLFDQVASGVIGVMEAAGFSFLDSRGALQLALAISTDLNFRESELIDSLTQAFGNRRPSVVVHVDEIPRTSTGKVRRRELARQLELGGNV